jgi:hypothetical protein
MEAVVINVFVKDIVKLLPLLSTSAVPLSLMLFHCYIGSYFLWCR